MSLFRTDTTGRAIDAFLVGFLFIFFDIALGGVDIIPDVVGWVLVGLATHRLRRNLARSTDPRLGSAALVLSWASAAITGVFFLVSVAALFSRTAPVLGAFSYLYVFSGLISMLAVAALAAFLEGHARRYGASSTTLKIFRAGWIVALVSAGLALLAALAYLGVIAPLVNLFFLSLISLAAGILTGLGVHRSRNEGLY